MDDLDKESRCYNGGGQHNFRPRYNREPDSNMTNRDDLRFLSSAQTVRETYVCDVCKWCGKVENKNK